MSQTIATWLVVGLALYAGIGLVFAVVFVTRGVGTIDPLAREGSRGFRLAILPGVVALWPLMARRWARRQPPPEEHNPHRDLARKRDRG